MDNRKIDHEVIADNLKKMIEVLEFDSMRSQGKAKLNSQHLHSMYWLLQNVYNKPVAKVPANKKVN